MTVTARQVEEIARLAALGLDQPTLAALTDDIRRILEYVSQLDAVGDDAPDEPDVQPSGPPQPLRDDQPHRATLAIPIEQVAPRFRDGLFIVPRPKGFDDDGASTPSPES